MLKVPLSTYQPTSQPVHSLVYVQHNSNCVTGFGCHYLGGYWI